MRTLEQKARYAAKELKRYHEKKDEINAARRKRRLERPGHSAALLRAWHKRNPGKRAEFNKRWAAENPEKKAASDRAVRAKRPEHYKAKHREWLNNNADHMNEYGRARYAAGLPREMLRRAKRGAERRGWECNLCLEDIVIPTHCRYFGTELKKGTGNYADHSPSIDRIDSSKGYIKGNIEIISWRANRLKSDGTALEHLLIAQGIMAATGPSVYTGPTCPIPLPAALTAAA